MHQKKKTQEFKKKEDELEKTIKYLREQITSFENKVSGKPNLDEKVKEKGTDVTVKE